MADEYAKLTGDQTGVVITGKPVGQGGSLGREMATARGGYYVFEAFKEDLGFKASGLEIVIQGFGNVGSNAAKIFSEAGYKIVAVSDCTGGIYSPKGLGITSLLERRDKLSLFDNLKLRPEESRITNEQLLALECDLLIPAALENAITADNVNNIKAKAILELANGPITPEADQVLMTKNKSVIPDILANSGGVIVSYFEWLQNLSQEAWTEQQVNAKLKTIITKATKNVAEIAKTKKTTMRIAAFIVAIDKLVK